MVRAVISKIAISLQCQCDPFQNLRIFQQTFEIISVALTLACKLTSFHYLLFNVPLSVHCEVNHCDVAADLSK